MSGVTLLYFLILITSLLVAFPANAVCPVCTVAVGVGLGFSRWLGIDDLISGVWIGGLIVSLIIWSLNWLNKKQIKFKLSWLAISILFYGLTIIPLYFSGIIGHPMNKFYGIDKILFGAIFGSLVFLLSFSTHVITSSVQPLALSSFSSRKNRVFCHCESTLSLDSIVRFLIKNILPTDGTF